MSDLTSLSAELKRTEKRVLILLLTLAFVLLFIVVSAAVLLPQTLSNVSDAPAEDLPSAVVLGDATEPSHPFPTLNDEEFASLLASPFDYRGSGVSLLVEVVQFDEATGVCAFRASASNAESKAGFANTLVLLGDGERDCPDFVNSVEVGERYEVRAKVLGSDRYEVEGYQYEALTLEGRELRSI